MTIFNPTKLQVPFIVKFRAWMRSPTTMIGLCLLFVVSYNMDYHIWTVNFSWPYIVVSIFLVVMQDNTYTSVVRNRLVEIILEDTEKQSHLPSEKKLTFAESLFSK